MYPNRNIPNLYQICDHYYFNKPLLEQIFRDGEYITTYRTNIQGYRIDNNTNEMDSIKACDWLFVGDSYTQGAQVSYSELFSTLLYHSFPDKIIVNVGISGAGIYDEYNYFIDKGLQLKPKKVFLQIGVFNDFFNVKENSASLQDYLMAYSDLYRYFEYNILNNDKLPLSRWTEPFAPSKEENIDYNILFRQSSTQKERDKQEFVNCLTAFKEAVEKHGGELVILLLPSKEQISDEMLNEVMRAYKIKTEELDMTYPNRWMKEITSKLNIKLIDVYSDFRASVVFPFFQKDEHLNSIGHQLIANRLKSEFISCSFYYDYISLSNNYDRYPTIYDEGMSVLHQSMDNKTYSIILSNSNFTRNEILCKGVSELIHPMLSSDQQLLVYTEGDQNIGQTDIILYNRRSGERTIVTKGANKYGSIPTFNHKGDKIVYASWRDTSRGFTLAGISIYDIKRGNDSLLIDGKEESWRPIFSISDDQVFFIQKDSHTKKFLIKSIDLNTHKETIEVNMDYDIWDIALSPSGKYILYAGNKDKNWDIFLFDRNAYKAKQITKSIGDEWDPTFGADDTDIWFAGVMGTNNGIYHKNVLW